MTKPAVIGYRNFGEGAPPLETGETSECPGHYYDLADIRVLLYYPRRLVLDITALDFPARPPR